MIRVSRNLSMYNAKILCVYRKKIFRQACVHFVSIRGQKIRKNIKTNETIRKDKISCFQSHSVHLLDIKQLTKTGGQESLLPSHSYNLFIINNLQEYLNPL